MDGAGTKEDVEMIGEVVAGVCGEAAWGMDVKVGEKAVNVGANRVTLSSNTVHANDGRLSHGLVLFDIDLLKGDGIVVDIERLEVRTWPQCLIVDLLIRVGFFLELFEGIGERRSVMLIDLTLVRRACRWACRWLLERICRDGRHRGNYSRQ